MIQSLLTSIIVDDEQMARYGLRSYVNRTPSLICLEEFQDVRSLEAYLAGNSAPDIIFMDIRMPEVSGLDFIASRTLDSAIIIVSAYEQYALKGFDLNVCDYLLKPVSYERFLKAIDKVWAFLSARRMAAEEGVIYLKGDRKLQRVFKKDIEYLEAVENYVKVVTKTDRILTRTTLKVLLSSLKNDGVIRTHKSYAVNLRKIILVEKDVIITESKYKIPLSRANRKDVMRGISEDL